MCDCHSYNGYIGTDPEVILDPRPYFPGTTKTVCVDACIADEIKALWSAGIWTGGCCCGHNGYFGEDRPSVIIYQGYNAAKAKHILSEIDPHRDWKVQQWQLMEI